MKRLLKKIICGGFLAVFAPMAPGLLAQTMPGPQTSFLPPRPQLHPKPTPVGRASQNFQAYRRSLQPKHKTVQNKFYSLNPKPKPTPQRTQNLPGKPLTGNPINQAATVMGPRQIHYPTLYQDRAQGVTAGLP